MPRANPITTTLFINGIEVRPIDYVTMDNGVVLVTVTTVDGLPMLRGRCSKPPYWMDTNTIQVEKSEIVSGCQHEETYTETIGSRWFSDGDVDDDIHEVTRCCVCGEEIDPPAPVATSEAELAVLCAGMI